MSLWKSIFAAMLISMTGYGRAGSEVRNHQIRIEIKSVNSKFSEYRFRLPVLFRDKEFEIRKLLSTSIDRGKIDFLIEQTDVDHNEVQINTELFNKYAQVLKTLSAGANLAHEPLIPSILSLPNVVETAESSLSDEEWIKMEGVIKHAIEEFNAFRKHEGLILAEVIKTNVMAIKQHLSQVENVEKNRMDQLKVRLSKMLSEFANRPEYDANRFEQELLYYIEKMDFTEEKIRLSKHCDYFIEKLIQPSSNGRELNFISQEMGREINTLGSKAQDHHIQHLVVAMKDELEKIKEQLANVV